MIPRDERIITELPMLYRARGEAAWHVARTQNVSRTGVLFKADDLMSLNSPLEMTFDMVSLSSMKLAEVATVVWRGNVVRTVPPQGQNGGPRIAATLAECEMLNKSLKAEV